MQNYGTSGRLNHCVICCTNIWTSLVLVHVLNSHGWGRDNTSSGSGVGNRISKRINLVFQLFFVLSGRPCAVTSLVLGWFMTWCTAWLTQARSVAPGNPTTIPTVEHKIVLSGPCYIRSRVPYAKYSTDTKYPIFILQMSTRIHMTNHGSDWKWN